jgi:hypothetical protein
MAQNGLESQHKKAIDTTGCHHKAYLCVGVDLIDDLLKRNKENHIVLYGHRRTATNDTGLLVLAHNKK